MYMNVVVNERKNEFFCIHKLCVIIIINYYELILVVAYFFFKDHLDAKLMPLNLVSSSAPHGANRKELKGEAIWSKIFVVNLFDKIYYSIFNFEHQWKVSTDLVKIHPAQYIITKLTEVSSSMVFHFYDNEIILADMKSEEILFVK